MLCHRIPAAPLGSRQPARLAPRAALGTEDAPPAPAAPAQGAAAVPARPLAPRAEPTRPHAEQAAEQSTLGHRLASGVVYAVERAAVALAGGRAATNSYLSGNFAPVEDERFDVGLEVVEGALPPELEGAFLRNGPNPAVPPTGGYHWFDGDGTVHAVRIKDGAAAYCNAWVDTARLRQERAAGFPQFIKFGDTKGALGVVHALLKNLKEEWGVNNPGKYGSGTANTALAFHHGRILALHEADLPYVLRLACDGLLRTLGRLTWGGAVDHDFTAHPKIDPRTGEMLFFGYSVGRAPYCWFGALDASGQLVKDFPVPLPQPIMMHDFAVTEDYVIFFDCSLVFKPETMVKLGGSPFTFDKARPTRFGVLPRTASDASEIRWFETEPLAAFHTANAWQEGDKIKLYLCTFEEFSLDMEDFNPSTLPYLTEVVMDHSTGRASTRRVAGVGGDFPQVPPSLVGRKSRYTYMATMASGVSVPSFTGIAKIDLQATDPAQAVAGVVEFGPQRFGGEAVFVPAQQQQQQQQQGTGEVAEDSGYLLTFVHDEGTGQTDLAVYDAQTMSSKPVARVRMPRRVPYGFHGLWVSEEQLQQQAKQG